MTVESYVPAGTYEDRLDRIDNAIAARPLEYPAQVYRGKHFDKVQRLAEGEYVKLSKRDGKGEVFVDRDFAMMLNVAFGIQVVR